MLSKLQVKYIQSLGQKKFRDIEGTFVAEGPKLVEEILQSASIEITAVYALKNWMEQNSTLLKKLNVTEISEEYLSKISSLKTANRVVAVVKKIKEDLSPDLKGKITLVLDAIRDPGNLGTIIRIADWFGVKNIICSKDCADCYNSKVIQSTMGSIARVNIIYTELNAFLKEYPGIRIYAAGIEGKDVKSMTRLHEGIIVIGNESQGISPEMEKLANVKITISRVGKAESLNAAVATAIILSHLS